MVKTFVRISRTSNKNREAGFEVGTVLSTKPLKIQISSKKTLTREFLFLSPFCVKVEIKRDGSNFILWRGLKKGDKVLVLRASGGQFYYVMQRQEGIL